MSVTVKSPDPLFEGVVAGVAFAKGQAKADPNNDAAALAYFERTGYTVGSYTMVDPGATPEPPTAKQTLEAITPPVDRNAVAEQTFPGEGEGERSRVDVAVPPFSGPGSGIDEWRTFAKLQDPNVNLTGLSRDDIIALSRQRSWA